MTQLKLQLIFVHDKTNIGSIDLHYITLPPNKPNLMPFIP